MFDGANDTMLILSLLSDAIEESNKYLLFYISCALVLRLARFPDLGLPGAFLVGAAATAVGHRCGIVLPIAIVGAAILGAVAGLLTAMIYARGVNPLVAGLITLAASYTTAHVLLGPSAHARVGNPVSYALLGGLGGFVALVLCILFSTKYALGFRVAGASPPLLRKMGLNPTARIAGLVIAGNSIAAIGGGLCASVSTVASLRGSSELLVDGIMVLVLGEAVLSIIWYTAQRVRRWVPQPRLAVVLVSEARVYVTGTGALGPLVAAVLGAYVYWVTYTIVVRWSGADAYTPSLFAAIIAIWLVFGRSLVKRQGVLPPWTFLDAAK